MLQQYEILFKIREA